MQATLGLIGQEGFSLMGCRARPAVLGQTPPVVLAGVSGPSPAGTCDGRWQPSSSCSQLSSLIDQKRKQTLFLSPTEMVGGRLCCLSRSLQHSGLLLHTLLHWVYLHDAEASDCQLIFHKQVGDTVEFPSCSPPEGVDFPTWNYNKDTLVAENTMTVYPKSMFQDRVELNPKNFSLTVRNLTRQDSGVFSFLSEVNGQQRHTVTITLQVHEPITVPVLTAKTTWNASTASCTVWLECISRSDSNVTYKWAVGNQTLSGRRLTYSIWPLDGGTRFTCNISDSVREESASKTVKCMNATSDAAETENLILFVGVAAGGALMVVIAAVIGVCNCKHRQAGGDSNDLTVYADIADVAIVKDRTSALMNSSVYDTIDNRVAPPPGPLTVYDEIQLSRMRKATESPS
ncbi:T-cell surface antigen CD2 isoform X2 [Scophthalmus maximus]|uniref:T-cell surface antigen CD2 isoform X2 n=1 Tax=Scophthalmus maximus TaxID=52904 RepID=UPI001FA8F9FD|nr:T-cell surface antigen CD2 isoform X2 [Scophthalmus maximus]